MIIKKIIFSGSLVFSIVICVLAVGVQAADSPAPLTAEQEQKLMELATHLTAGPSVVLVAELRPPQTVYGVELRDEEYQRLIGDLANLGLSTTTRAPGVTDWTMDISCGDAQNYTGEGDQKIILLGRRIWSHPDGPGGCPHEEGTSHKGTISVKGDFIVELKKGGENLIAATFSLTCSYSGSESGTSVCETKVERWEGRYGNMVPGSTDNSEWNVSVTVISTVIIAIGGGYIIIRIRRKIQEEKGWPTAKKY